MEKENSENKLLYFLANLFLICGFGILTVVFGVFYDKGGWIMSGFAAIVVGLLFLIRYSRLQLTVEIKNISRE